MEGGRTGKEQKEEDHSGRSQRRRGRERKIALTQGEKSKKRKGQERREGKRLEHEEVARRWWTRSRGEGAAGITVRMLKAARSAPLALLT